MQILLCLQISGPTALHALNTRRDSLSTQQFCSIQNGRHGVSDSTGAVLMVICTARDGDCRLVLVHQQLSRPWWVIIPTRICLEGIVCLNDRIIVDILLLILKVHSLSRLVRLPAASGSPALSYPVLLETRQATSFFRSIVVVLSLIVDAIIELRLRISSWQITVQYIIIAP